MEVKELKSQSRGSDKDLRPPNKLRPPSLSHNSPGSRFPNYLSVFNDRRDSGVSSNSNQWALSTGSWFPWWRRGDELPNSFLPDVERVWTREIPSPSSNPSSFTEPAVFSLNARVVSEFHSSVWEKCAAGFRLSFFVFQPLGQTLSKVLPFTSFRCDLEMRILASASSSL